MGLENMKRLNYKQMIQDAKGATEKIPELLRENNDMQCAEIIGSIEDDIKSAIRREINGEDESGAFVYAETLEELSRKLRAVSLLSPNRVYYFVGYVSALADTYRNLVNKRDIQPTHD